MSQQDATGQPATYRIGVDVGGTNTDAVVLCDDAPNDKHGVLASCKHATTADVTKGIEIAVRTVLENSEIDPGQVCAITIGTTHFINAVLERDRNRLRPVAVLRLSTRFTRSTPPFVTFPTGLRDIMCGYYAYCDGGCNIDGSQIRKINPEQIRVEAREICKRGIRNVVLSGVYSPIDETFRQEEQAASILRQELPDANVVCSRTIANIGLLERENASILNASILEFARETIQSFEAVLQKLNLSCSLYLTQNDGTIVDAASAAEVPIKTFSSGATNSMRGAAYLAGFVADRHPHGIIVADIGGTTTDVGMLLPSGFPRQASAYVNVAGVRLNFPMPDLTSIALGGGSIVRPGGAQDLTVGPDSVGYKLIEEALAFGGGTLTTTDIVVGAGAARLGDRDRVSHLPDDLVRVAQKKITAMLASVVESMKVSPEPLPVMLVGGGSIIAPDTLPGASLVLRPPHHDVANAVGAAIAKISGTVDVIELMADRTTDQVVQACRKRAVQRCIDGGALPASVTVVEIATIPIQYTSNQLRVIVKCVGELDITRPMRSPPTREVACFAATSPATGNPEQSEADDSAVTATSSKASGIEDHDEIDRVDLKTYRPHITEQREWILSALDLKFLEIGTYVLGCAGGGSPFPEYLQLRDMLRNGHTLRVAECDSVADNAVVLWGGHMGSPAVSTERLGGEEVVDAMSELLSLIGMQPDAYHAVMSLEIGGGNGLQPLIFGSSKFLDKPCLDCDWMGRAYPTYYQTTLTVHREGELVPAAIASGDGKTLIMTRTTDDVIVDVALRAACSEMGSRVGMAAKPSSAALVKAFAVRNTISLAWRIGRCILTAQRTSSTAGVADALIAELGGHQTAKKLFVGKIVRCESKLHKGHSYGSIVIATRSTDELDSAAASTCAASFGTDTAPEITATTISAPMRTTGLLRIPYKNENILAEHFPSWEALRATEADSAAGTSVADGGDGSCGGGGRVGEVLASVPDLIAVLDCKSGENLGVPEFRYGLKVLVLAITASPLWTGSERGLELGGPQAFGYGDSVQYRAVGKYVEPRSVIAEYARAPRTSSASAAGAAAK